MLRILARCSLLAAVFLFVAPARAAQAPHERGAAPVATSALLALAPDRGAIALATQTAPTASIYTITATATGNGTISPSGDQKVLPTKDQTFTMTPMTCAQVDNVRVDGVDLGPLTKYTFHNVNANHTIEAIFGQVPPDTITASAGAHGTISPIGVAPYDCDATVTYTITPDVCFKISDVRVDGLSVGVPPSYTFYNLRASHTIVASFSPDPQKLTITATAGANGKIAPAGAIQVDCGTDNTFAISPNGCYRVADVQVDGASQGPITSYTFTNVLAAHSIAATFVYAPTPDTLTASAGPGGSIEPAGVLVLGCGSTQTFTIRHDDCQRIADVVVDGVSQGAVVSFTFTDLATSHTITASFVPIVNVPITATAGSNGTITPSGVVQVGCGADQTFTIAAAPPSPNGCPYEVADVLVDGVSQGPIASYTFTNVRTAHTITASFTAGLDTLTASAGPGGSIEPSGAIVLACPSTQAFTIRRDACYRVADVQVDGASQGPITSYTFTNVQGNHTITASFASSPQYPIVASAGPGGTIVPSGTVQVDCGANQTFTITPEPNFVVNAVTVDGHNPDSTTSYTFTNVNDAHSISVQFSPVYSIGVLTAACDSGRSKPVVFGRNFQPNTTYWFDVRPDDHCQPPPAGAHLEKVGSVQTDGFGQIVTSDAPCFDPRMYAVILDVLGTGVYVPVYDPADCFLPFGVVATNGIQDLSGEITPEGAVLSWWLMDLTSYRGFVVHRAPEGGEEVVVTPTPLAPPSSHPPAEMRWRDDSAAPGSRYAYRIEALKSAGTGSDWYGPVTLSIPAAPTRLALRGATPNPFSGTTHLAMDMPANEGELRMDVFDVAGRHVRTLRPRAMSPGQDVVDWDGLDDHGAPARGGLYMVRVQGARGASVIRIMKLD